jgi:4-aminobutyrate aminotransferase
MAAQVTTAKLPKIITPLPGPKAKDSIEQDHRYISPSYTRSYPLVAKSGYGAIVEDVDGNLFLDFSAGIAVCSTGHCHPNVVRAIQKQAESLIHMSGTDFYYDLMPQLARKLESLMPDKKEWRCFYGNSGAEAIEAALKLARYATGRSQFIAFHSSFHGRTMGALSLTSSKPVQRKGFGPLVPGVTHVPYGNADYIEDVLFKTTVNPGEVAAIIVEAIQGEGGYIVPSPDFLPRLQEIARMHGILLVVDEVQSGMGRTGRWFAFEHFGIQPDIVAIAKGIASGMPLGVMMAHADVMTWTPGAHASTFGGNPVCIAAALETIRLIEEQYLANAAAVGSFLKSKLEEMKSRHRSSVIEVRGIGLMLGVQMKTPVLRDRIITECFHRGLLVLGAGPSTIRLSPPLVIDEEQAAFAAATLSDAIAAAA